MQIAREAIYDVIEKPINEARLVLQKDKTICPWKVARHQVVNFDMSKLQLPLLCNKREYVAKPYIHKVMPFATRVATPIAIASNSSSDNTIVNANRRRANTTAISTAVPIPRKVMKFTNGQIAPSEFSKEKVSNASLSLKTLKSNNRYSQRVDCYPNKLLIEVIQVSEGNGNVAVQVKDDTDSISIKFARKDGFLLTDFVIGNWYMISHFHIGLSEFHVKEVYLKKGVIMHSFP